VIVYPAIDLLGGSCVRLVQGDYDAVTRFSADPVAVAERFAEQGAEALHVIDLDGAREGRPMHGDLVRRIAAATSLPLQVGGGIRSADAVAAYLRSGAHRVLIGTAAVEDPGWLGEAIREFGSDRLAAAVDVRDGEVVTNGWVAGSGKDAAALAESLGDLGVETLLYTDTRRDGTLTSADVRGTGELVARGFRVIAAGGISSVEDIRALAAAGAAGAVVGSALYRGRMTLRDAMEAAC
jgi:phosphoribosylformimino-5-aminoimidazole carboxamide ribotide isomerase